MNKKLLLLGFTLVAIPRLRSYNDYRRFSLACDLRKRADELDHRLQSKEALAVLIQARDAYPDFLDTYQEMAEIPIEQSRWDEAYAAVDEAVRRCPKNPESLAVVYRQRGFCLARWGKLAESAADRRVALSHDGDDGFSQHLLEKVEARLALTGRH